MGFVVVLCAATDCFEVWYGSRVGTIPYHRPPYPLLLRRATLSSTSTNSLFHSPCPLSVASAVAPILVSQTAAVVTYKRGSVLNQRKMNDGHAGGAGGGSFPNLDEFNFNIDEIDLDNISSELLAGPSQLSQMQSSATQTTSGDFLSRIPTGDLGVPSQATMSYGSALSQQPQAIDPSVVEHFRHQLNPNPIQPPGVPQPLAPPNPMPTSTEAAVPASSDSTAPLILKGRDIQGTTYFVHVCCCFGKSDSIVDT